VWRQAAENVAESLTRGMRVTVTGRLGQRSYGDQGRREAHRLRARGRRAGPVVAERLGEGHQGHPFQRQRGKGRGHARQLRRQGR
jgi:single-stranded DNA-binding protein